MSGVSGERQMAPHEREQILAEIARSDKESEAFQKAGEAKQQQLLESLEKGLHHRRRLFTEAAPEVAQACRRLCEACNFIATRMLQQDNMKAAQELLKRAEQVADKHDMDRATTWNNLACYYRRQGKLRTAVTYLERALQVEEHNGSSDAAQSHLNICATLSQLGRHADALYHAQSALIRIYEILSPLMLHGELNAKGQAPPERQEQLTVLCIAYHNLAVEQEYLQNYDAAASAYAEGMRWAAKFLGEGHQLGGIMRSSMDAVKSKLPKGSGALRRWDELVSGGFSKPQLDNLMTPRSRAPEGSAELKTKDVFEHQDAWIACAKALLERVKGLATPPSQEQQRECTTEESLINGAADQMNARITVDPLMSERASREERLGKIQKIMEEVAIAMAEKLSGGEEGEEGAN